jgi:hypothetical protein
MTPRVLPERGGDENAAEFLAVSRGCNSQDPLVRTDTDVRVLAEDRLFCAEKRLKFVGMGKAGPVNWMLSASEES